MKSLHILILLCTLIILTNCRNNHLNQIQNPKLKSNFDHHQPLKQQKSQINNHRNLFVFTQKNIRMTIDTTNLTTLTTNTSNQVLTFIQNVMSVVQTFIKSRIQVTPLSNNIFAPSGTGKTYCNDYVTSQNDVVNGIANSDLHVYVSYITNSNFSYVAQGKYCVQIPISASADTSLSAGRPIMGSIKFNTNSSLRPLDGVTLTNRLFADTTASAIHEMIHILGFDNDLYAAYLNPLTGIKYGIGNVVDATSTNVLSSSKYKPNSKMIVTPNVVSQAKAYFDCPTITGMPLEDEETLTAGTTYSAHWEKSLLYDQLMTVTPFDAQRGISVITYALLQDMGWYTVDTTFNDTMPYGYKRGCDFFYKLCKDSLYNEFCDPTSLNKSCSPQSFSKAVCQVDPYTNGCGIWVSALYCVDPNSQDDGYKTVSQQVYGTNSFCVSSTLATVSVAAILQGRCYPYVCYSNPNSIQFTIGSSLLYCMTSDVGTQKTLSGYSGTLTCPDYNSFCTNSRKVCPNWCSQNGFCTGGICNCNYGYSGADCSINTCTSPYQYYITSNNTCISNTITCPSGTYANLYAFTCLPCSQSCSNCVRQSTICVSCIGVNNLLYKTECVSICPSGYFQNSNICSTCSNLCATCSKISTNCTSCNNTFYLDPQTSTCIEDCQLTTNHKLSDTVYNRCLASCDLNLVLINSTNCGLCNVGKYKQPSAICSTTCPSGFYTNTTTRNCDKCDASCQTCSGTTSQNCTSCFSTNINAYLLLSMCVIGTACPIGTYADTVNYACTMCPSNLNCYNCFYSSTNSGPACTSCLYGYYINLTTFTCSATCVPGTYQNNANGTCSSCNSSCLTCSSGSSSGCLSCANLYYYLANSTGRYCLNSCPTGYILSNQTCAQCYSTCKTCIGIYISNCSTCVTGMYLAYGHCYFACPSGSYKQNISFTCQPCNSNCTFCYGPSNGNCTKCIASLVLDNQTCSTNCSNGLGANEYNICWQIKLLSISIIGILLIMII